MRLYSITDFLNAAHSSGTIPGMVGVIIGGETVTQGTKGVSLIGGGSGDGVDWLWGGQRGGSRPYQGGGGGRKSKSSCSGRE